jgi:tetratricopeptide (TPR) repeat protein
LPKGFCRPARVPDSSEVRWARIGHFGFHVACDRAFSPPFLAAHVVRELELARLAGDADAALAAGELDAARNGYVALLERSPRDADVARRLADLDRVVGGRSEAALATLLEAMPAAEAGFLAGELLASTDNLVGSVLALRQAAEREIYGPLAALALLRASQATETIRERLELLDQAVARSPALEGPRWSRFSLRLELADLKGAMADAEHLEAAARGAHRRHDVWQRAAEGLLSHGHHAKAVTLFERALRYVPDNASAVSGLAQSLMLAGARSRLDRWRARSSLRRQGAPAHDAVLAPRAHSPTRRETCRTPSHDFELSPPASRKARRAGWGRYRANLGILRALPLRSRRCGKHQLAKDIDPQHATQ